MNITRTTDFETIARLNKHVHNIHTALYPDQFKPYNQEAITAFFKGMVQRDNHIFLLAEEAEKPIGYVWAEIKYVTENVFRKAYATVYVHQLSMNADKRNSGYGAACMQAIEELAAAEQISRIELDYWAGNEAAKRFYQRHGYQIYREFVYKELPK